MLENILHGSTTDGKRLILVGGFLGAGKTTLIGKMVSNLQAQGLHCGVITNDQAGGLVDTALVGKLDGAKISEIAGGCFCCKLDELEDVLKAQWSGVESSASNSFPDVIVAEPVGSCTDLVATVVLPLRKAFGDSVNVSPLSVLVDARRALSSLGGRRTPGDFSKDVGYIYRKQIEEAEIVVVNKKDLLNEEDLADLLARLAKEFPDKEVFPLSARTGDGLDPWIRRITHVSSDPRKLMEVDYDRYGAGEALLGWCNAEVRVECPAPRGGDEYLTALADVISARLFATGAEVAHFKMALAAEGRLGVINQVMSGTAAEVSRSFSGTFSDALLTVNLRAEAEPEELKKIVEECISMSGVDGLSPETLKLVAFKPGMPVPVERITVLG